MRRFVIPLRFVVLVLISWTVHQTDKYLKLYDHCSRFLQIWDYGFWRCCTWMPRQISNNCNICLYEGEFACQKEDLWKPYYYVNPISIILLVSEYNLNTICITVHLNWFLKLVAFEEQLGSNLVFSWDDQFKTVMIECQWCMPVRFCQPAAACRKWPRRGGVRRRPNSFLNFQVY